MELICMTALCDETSLVLTLCAPLKNDATNLSTWYDNTGNMQRPLGCCTIPSNQRNWLQRVKNSKIDNARQSTNRRILQIYLQIELERAPYTNLTIKSAVKFYNNVLRGIPNL